MRRPLLAMSCAVLASATAAFAAPAASASTCSPSQESQPFLRWLDPAEYELAPGGDFENASWAKSSWTLQGGAKRVSGSEPFAATGTLGKYSLSLPAGSSATSPGTCVSYAYPTARFFLSGSGTVAVSVIYGKLVIPAGVAVATGGWAPSPVAVTLSAIPSLLNGGSAMVSIRLTALLGSPVVDDVFVDPVGRR